MTFACCWQQYQLYHAWSHMKIGVHYSQGIIKIRRLYLWETTQLITTVTNIVMCTWDVTQPIIVKYF